MQKGPGIFFVFVFFNYDERVWDTRENGVGIFKRLSKCEIIQKEKRSIKGERRHLT